MIAIVFPHQLFEKSPLFETHCETYLLIEEYLFFHQYKFHKQKILFHKLTMEYYAEYLKNKGYKVIHWKGKSKEESDIRHVIETYISIDHKEIFMIDPTDNWLEQRVKSSAKKNKLILHQLKSPLFLNSKEDNLIFFKKDKKKFFHATFYKQQRLKYQILINEKNEPVGDKWSFDDANRKKYPKGKTPPVTGFHTINSDHQTVIEVENQFTDHYGVIDPTSVYPTTFHEAKTWLDCFLKERFKDFGEFEDAIVQTELVLNHSLLSPLLNIGLLTPDYVISQILSFSNQNQSIPINSTEGLIRQIIGWREFIRGIYEVKGSEERTKNFFGFHKKIPPSFYDGTTGIPPVDSTIKKILKTGYCHHIERLMVMGNFMLLCEFNPDEVYKWFMELFIDAYDWVMVTNVYGMSQFADGGLMATKPYISSSNYIIKMSNYKRGDWQKTWDGLFWRFMDKHRNIINKNPRLRMLISSFDKMSEDKKNDHLAYAEHFCIHFQLPTRQENLF
ncbi:cryptochrome/photolyase family protein [Flammeovirga agarivorans]|uniref:cryptochrome/photolyase family protein n=1 Tax=Flammeovirga agarivorans TaxID=2726742 RepID=UPI001B3B2661|nr:cryptochrome/photolyase family protein [Flammeovirga agarivorans]